MRIICYILLLLIFTGCGKFLEEYSQDMVLVKSVSDLDEVLLGSAYLPSFGMDYMINGSPGWFVHISDDDMNTVAAFNAKRMQAIDQYYYGYTTWQLEVGRPYAGTTPGSDNKTWDALYQRINSVNIILSELEDLELKTDQEKLDAVRITGESHFLRAQFYLMLVNLYADAYHPDRASTTLGVPVKLTEYVEHDKEKNTQFERNPVSEVYARIERDLLEAVKCFTESPQTRSFYRASQEAALLLLSRVYLYMQEWEKAKQYASSFLTLRSQLSTLSSFATSGVLISEDNPEIVFTQGALNLQSEFHAYGGDFCVSKNLYNLYDTTDYRLDIYFAHSLQVDSLGFNRKFGRGNHRSYVSDLYLLRTAEGYLNMAEACAMLDDAEAASLWLNRLRRTRIRDYQDQDYPIGEIIEQVREERRKELCFEGHRWFDLRRYAVCKKAPFKKVIERMYAIYDWQFKALYKHTEVYRLEEDDPAYTFAIPISVLEFDTGLPDNPRKKRECNRVIINE